MLTDTERLRRFNRRMDENADRVPGGTPRDRFKPCPSCGDPVYITYKGDCFGCKSMDYQEQVAERMIAERERERALRRLA